ncbi:hypothetical protein AU476_27760 [Cupriavidus sp. UYMSc13B]|nr:hypothetical protein AU476_27760 [Cupriavidus sp. UYMSc13B]
MLKKAPNCVPSLHCRAVTRQLRGQAKIEAFDIQLGFLRISGTNSVVEGIKAMVLVNESVERIEMTLARHLGVH